MGLKALWRARKKVKGFRTADGREITPMYIEFITGRTYEQHIENQAYVTGWNAAMDMIFGIYTPHELDKPDLEIVKEIRNTTEEIKEIADYLMVYYNSHGNGD